jgi:hypothetical protein
MQPEGPSVLNGKSEPGLPPVVPPSGKFIVQLFLVPFIIVVSVVGFLLFVNWLVGSGRDPDDFLKRLDNSNPDVRWRAAEDLAQVLLRDDGLASNPKFGLDLAERLEQALRNAPSAPVHLKDPAATGSGNGAPAEQPADAEDGYILYLSACLGNVSIPVGAPVLTQMASKHTVGDSTADVRRRWRALWALANLGENLKRFERLPAEAQQTVLDSLRAETQAKGTRGEWSQTALGYLEGTDVKSLGALGLEAVFKSCAGDADPFVRSMSAFAMNFWNGTPAENARIDDLLVKLSRDDGHGEEGLSRMRESEGQDSECVSRSPGLKIRYNATVALARRGSNKTRLDVLAEMLDEDQQRQNFRIREKDGREITDEATVGVTIATALKAVTELHRKNPERDLSSLAPALDKLTQNDKIALRSEAERTRLSLRQ